MTPAILFEPDGYVLSGDRLMGRQSAGEGFLRAAIGAMHGSGEVWAYTPKSQSAEIFSRVIRKHDPRLTPRWCRSDNVAQLANLGGLYLPGPDLSEHAQRRARIGHAAYSLTGITHTIASHRAMDAIGSVLTAPVMPWDALICTSTAAVETVRILLSEQASLLRWRFGKELDFTLPLTPLIPLGVHLDDFAYVAKNRDKARAELGIDEDSVVLLFSGRLSFHAKAHPHAMYVAAERVALETGKKLVLIQNGWFANEGIEAAFRNGTATYAPNVRHVFSDGRNDDEWARSWAAADIFLSLSDNIQETFGLTPIEAMSAGLPTIVSDWNGYKDTVRDGIDGFRIPTFAPAPGYGVPFAARYETGVDNYDYYSGLTCQMVSVDHDILANRLNLLVSDRDLRLRMGAAGKLRVGQSFDWKVVFQQYQALWEQQARMRSEVKTSDVWAARLASAPRQSPSRIDPFVAFAHYPTDLIGPEIKVQLRSGSEISAYRRMAADPLYSYATAVLPDVEHAERIFECLLGGPVNVSQLSVALNVPIPQLVRACAVMAKMGFIIMSYSD